MSAFQLSPAHLARAVSIVRSTRDGHDAHAGEPMLTLDCEELYKCLAQWNAINLRHLYAACHGAAAEPVPMPEGCAFPFVAVDTVVDIAAAIKVLDCVAYQCCDVKAWDTSDPAAVLRAARESLIRRIPGFRDAYQSAAWSL